jgi:DNA-binding HxlR family transcriptional regulator
MVPYRKSRVAPITESDCPLATCLRLMAGAWTPNILWYLREEPRRFSELKGDLAKVSAKVLSARLRELVDAGLIDRKVMDTSPPTVEYSLTPIGRRLEPALQAMVDVGMQLKRLRRNRADSRAPAVAPAKKSIVAPAKKSIVAPAKKSIVVPAKAGTPSP